MKFITLKEFQNQSALSDRALVWLLHNKKLALQADQEHGLMIDIDSADMRNLIEAITTSCGEVLPERLSLITERFSSIIADNLQSICEEALQIVRSGQVDREG